MDYQSVEKIVGLFGFFVGNAAVAYFLRFSGMGKYYRTMQKKIEHAALTPGETVLTVDSDRASEVMSPLDDIERRITDRLHHIEMKTGCEFSHMSRMQLSANNEMLAKHIVNAAELIEAIDEHTMSMAKFSNFLKSLNGRLRIAEEGPKT